MYIGITLKIVLINQKEKLKLLHFIFNYVYNVTG
nr:MAG TPA: hypothetical protein [Caudoviricetes sp.]